MGAKVASEVVDEKDSALLHGVRVSKGRHVHSLDDKPELSAWKKNSNDPLFHPITCLLIRSTKIQVLLKCSQNINI